MVFAKKSLGQNFLHSEGALAAIVEAGNASKADTILEIGPGRGALTAKLLETGARVIAVEKDRELIPVLEEKFAKQIKSKQLSLMEGDILELTAKDILGKISSYKLIANIPYYITGEIIRKFFEEKIQPVCMVLLVQKEVAERIVSRDGKESILSIAVKAYATPRYVRTVKRGEFAPSPNVDSAIVAFEAINKDIFKKNDVSEQDFFDVMKLGFAHKRKKLGGNLKPVQDMLNADVFAKFKDMRAEELAVSDWVTLLKK